MAKSDIDYIKEFAESKGYDINNIYKILNVKDTKSLKDVIKKITTCFECGDDRVEYVRIVIKKVGGNKQKVNVYYFCGLHGKKFL